MSADEPDAADGPMADRLRRFYADEQADLDRMAAGDDPTVRMDPTLADAWAAVDDIWVPGHAIADPSTPTPTPPRLPGVGALLAAAAVLLLGVGWRLLTADEGPALMIKGPPTARLTVLATRGGGEAFEVRPDTPLRADDRLGFFISAEAPGFVAVYLIDRSGAVRLAPSGGRIGAHPAGARVVLPEGARMTPGSDCEWFMAALADRPLPLESFDVALGPDPDDVCRPPPSIAAPGVRWQRLRVRR